MKVGVGAGVVVAVAPANRTEITAPDVGLIETTEIENAPSTFVKLSPLAAAASKVRTWGCTGDSSARA